jgi:outer membrane protein assembly factor BamB
MGSGGGSAVTAGGLVFRGDPDGNFVAIDAGTGDELWRFQTGFGADAPAILYEVDGDEYVAIATGGSSSNNKGAMRNDNTVSVGYYSSCSRRRREGGNPGDRGRQQVPSTPAFAGGRYTPDSNRQAQRA